MGTGAAGLWGGDSSGADGAAGGGRGWEGGGTAATAADAAAGSAIELLADCGSGAPVRELMNQTPGAGAGGATATATAAAVAAGLAALANPPVDGAELSSKPRGEGRSDTAVSSADERALVRGEKPETLGMTDCVDSRNRTWNDIAAALPEVADRPPLGDGDTGAG